MASLPFSAGIVFGTALNSKLVERTAPRLVAGPGLLVAAAGMYWLSTLDACSSYFGRVMPGVLITSLGLGMSVVAMTLTAVYKVAEDSTGVASALVNMAQQLGAALGSAIFTTGSISVAGDAGSAASAAGALVKGYAAAFGAGAAMLLLATVVMAIAIKTRQTQSAHAAMA